uniref:Uncharacterized protein n=1 Tax=Leersia perrieri TaxID=77586 RepID=A0A0D9WRT8_9ORYZ
MSGSAFKVAGAGGVEPQVVHHAGAEALLAGTLEAMRLRRCHRTTPSLLGVLTQVKRLVVVESQEMYAARRRRPRRSGAP